MNPKDTVTLNNAGKVFLRGGRFPAPVGALYMNILNNTVIVLEIEKDTAWIKMIKKSYPYHEKRSNRFGVCRHHLEVI
ncbi:MAG: hypothetical protein IIB95_13855 [Candidatus Marinimicrobia bacterium]|nr:hypothetical protein [Candidatus Neomarinimicrobiota bacterium]